MEANEWNAGYNSACMYMLVGFLFDASLLSILLLISVSMGKITNL